MTSERRLAFGSVAELYDRVRPSYPDALVDDVLAFAAPVAHALEVGAGTGKATRLFAERGIAVHALEPSAEMAAVARRHSAGYAGVSIDLSDFEGFQGDDRRFDLIYSAQAWHWVSPSVRYVKARELLEQGGGLALFWNRARWESNPLRDGLRAAYARVAPDFGPLPGPMHPAGNTPPELWGDWRAEIEQAGGFEAPSTRAYQWRSEYSTSEYLELIQTHSDHIVLGQERLGALLDAVGEVIDRDGGGRLELEYVALLLLARAV